MTIKKLINKLEEEIKRKKEYVKLTQKEIEENESTIKELKEVLK